MVAAFAGNCASVPSWFTEKGAARPQRAVRWRCCVTGMSRAALAVLVGDCSSESEGMADLAPSR